METNKKSPKNLLFFVCINCDYNTSSKKDYNKHLLTLKHKRLTNANDLLTKILPNPQNEKNKICNCGKKYKHLSSLCKHKKKCLLELNKNNEISEKELIMMLIKQNSELVEVLKNGTHTTNSHNTNSLNKTFNLQFFLNETCKDAMNIMDFVDSIKLQLSDLENVGKIGFVEGISNIINSNLKALDVTQRPIHCTDKKREVLYIKDEDKWEKENDDKPTIRKVIKNISNKNTKMISIFREKHPDCNKSISKYSDQYNKLIIEAMGGIGDNDIEKENKIIKNISKNVTI